MFEVKSHKAIVANLHVITNNYSVLFNDGYNDVIYTGTNSFANRILGVIMFEDDEEGYLRYMHVIVTDDQYVDYLQKRISLKQIIQENTSFFVVDKLYNGKEKTANIVHIDDVPTDFLPLDNSFCPDFIKDPSLNYVIGLKGRKADLNLTEPEDLNNVNTHISALLKSATEILTQLNLNRHIYVEALPAGSFRIKFRIEVKEDTSSLFRAPITDATIFLNQFLVYIFEKLPYEKSDVFKQDHIDSREFKKLEFLLSELFHSSLHKPEAGMEQILIDTMNYSIENLKQINYNNSFERIEFINYTNSGVEIPLAVIDENYIPSVENKFFKIEKPEDYIEIDESPKLYHIQVYALNKETGNGAVYVQEKDAIFKAALHLRGRLNYQNTIFTHNMDETEAKLISIEAIGKRVNGIIKEVTYTYEN